MKRLAALASAALVMGLLLAAPVNVDYIRDSDPTLRLGWCINIPGGML